MKLLMHTCCAPCSVYCIDSLRNEGIEPTCYWYNPNIHPYIEYKTRRDTLIEYSKIADFSLIINEEYGLKEFCKNVIDDLENIAELLESDKLNLDESMQKFEEGMKTARLCNEKLENA